MTRRLAYKSLTLYRHTTWRNLTLIYSLGVGWMLDQALWSPPAVAIPLRAGLLLTVPALLAVITYTGWRQHREYPEGITLHYLLGIAGGLFSGIAILYLLAGQVSPPHTLRAIITGFTLSMLALALKNMAAIFLFSRKDTS